MAKSTFTLSAPLLAALLLLAAPLLGGCGGDGEGYASVGDPPNQDIAFASDAVQGNRQHAEFASAAITSDCASACTGVCSAICRQSCSVCPAAVSCVGRIGAGSNCEYGAAVCVVEHCPELLEDEDALACNLY